MAIDRGQKRPVLKNVKFVLSAAAPAQFPESAWPEVAFAGRSNVGKSSLINALLGQRKLAKVSREPGRTRQINFFAINEAFHLVDLPGYGFARAPKAVLATWQSLMLGYIERREELTACILLLDLRRTPNEEDLAVVDLLRSAGRPLLVVGTKADKLSAQQRQKQLALIARPLHLLPQDILVTSSESGLGLFELWESLSAFVPLSFPEKG